MSGLKVELYNQKEFYTNGDEIRGRIELTIHRRMDVEAIDVKLRCDEIASVVYSTGGVNKAEDRVRVKRVSILQRVFPPSHIDRCGYGVRPGVHSFEFTLTIPSSEQAQLGSLYRKSGGSKVDWYIKGVVRQRGRFHPNKRSRCTFMMQPQQPQPAIDTPRRICAGTCEDFKSHLPGACGGIRGLFRNSDFRKYTSVQLRLTFPEYGLPQCPERELGIMVSIECPDPHLIIWTDLSLYLKEKIDVRASSHSDRLRDKIALLRFKNQSFDICNPEQADVNEIFRKIHVGDNLLTPTFDTDNLTVSYKLVAEATVASRHHPSTRKRLRISSPICVLSRAVTIPCSYQSTKENINLPQKCVE